MASDNQANFSNGDVVNVSPNLRRVLSLILNALDSDAKDGKAAHGELAADLRAALAAPPSGGLADTLNSINHELADLNTANPGAVEQLSTVSACESAVRAQLTELVRAVRSIRFGPAHAIHVRGDDEPCYPQRKEWVEWLLCLCDAAAESCRATDAYRLLTRADVIEPTDELLEDNATTWTPHGPGPFAGKHYRPNYMVPMRRRVIQEVQS